MITACVTYSAQEATIYLTYTPYSARMTHTLTGSYGGLILVAIMLYTYLLLECIGPMYYMCIIPCTLNPLNTKPVFEI